MHKAIGFFAGLTLLVASLANAQQANAPAPQIGPSSVESQLTELAGLLGTMQMLQSLCSPQDQDFWRDRMQEMLRLEKPSIEQQHALINAFNAGYNGAESRFTNCTPEAHSLAVETAQKGEALAQALSTAGNGNSPG